MTQKLSKFLIDIGQELHEEGHSDGDNVIQPITKDEQLAREIWKRALGYTEEIKNSNGVAISRTYPPDPKAQQFIFERREGKFVTPPDSNPITLLKKISELTISRVNDMADQIVDDRNNNQTEP